MELTKITDNIYRSEMVDTRRMAVQIVGDCTAKVMMSVDGMAFSQYRVFSVIGSHVALLDLPEGGKVYLQVTSNVQPQIILI